MKQILLILNLTLVGLLLSTAVCTAQDPEPPITWKGNGVSTFIGQDETNDMDIDVRIHIDENGAVTGEVSSEEGSASIKKFYYAEAQTYEWREYQTRAVVIILVINEDGDNPLVVLMRGRVLVNRLLYGETLIIRLSSDIESALDMNDKSAILFDPKNLPQGLSNVIDKAMPIGLFKVEGAMSSE
ncbi:MAG: hypothetical protein JXR73_13965 [Candidatus Omnitrophica bacterium]|nr:hypothetical protein [Candidatus Omnitrophota bacterium]